MNDTSNPYATPASALQPTQAVPPVIGDYDFRIGDVISEAWASLGRQYRFIGSPISFSASSVRIPAICNGRSRRGSMPVVS